VTGEPVGDGRLEGKPTLLAALVALGDLAGYVAGRDR
jgi:hypothetical protein